jgi:hypothetical protein
MGTTKVFCQQLGEMKLYIAEKNTLLHTCTHTTPPSDTEHFPASMSVGAWLGQRHTAHLPTRILPLTTK